MFFTLFREKPVLPQGWDLRHLWAAQCMISSAVAADEARKSFHDPTQLRRRLKKDCVALGSTAGGETAYPMFPDEEFRDVVFAALDDYLTSEAEHILDTIHSQENLAPQPLPKSLLRVLEVDSDFKRFILAKAESLRRPHGAR